MYFTIQMFILAGLLFPHPTLITSAENILLEQEVKYRKYISSHLTCLWVMDLVVECRVWLVCLVLQRLVLTLKVFFIANEMSEVPCLNFLYLLFTRKRKVILLPSRECLSQLMLLNGIGCHIPHSLSTGDPKNTTGNAEHIRTGSNTSGEMMTENRSNL